MKISVLGTDYDMQVKKFSEDRKLSELDGYCNNYSKEIVIRDKTEMVQDDDREESKVIRMEHVKRHELVHAFLFESGLDNYSADEQLVDWIAIQTPKMNEAFTKAEGLE